MLGREDAISVAEAQRRMMGHSTLREPEALNLSVDHGYGRILSQDVFSPEDMPGFSRSTVDGYAVKSSDTFGASEGLPAYLTMAGEILMGEEPSFKQRKGTAVKISTGGMLPEGADAVVMLEHSQSVDNSLIEIFRPVGPRENVITAGEDMKKGDLLLKKGSILRPQDIAALAGVGAQSVMVYEKPRVSIISTGDEIVTIESPLRPGQVRDINSFSLAGLIQEEGGVPVKKGILRDVYEEIRRAVQESLDECDMVLITGGSSVGARDMTGEIINSLGSPGVLFHGVALKPGKPTIGAVLKGIPVFGLPGHPAAVVVCFDIFIKPILRVLSGRRIKSWEGRGRVRARLTKNISSTVGREEHIRVSLEEKDGALCALPVLGKSGLIRTLVKADGTIVIPPEARGIEEGAIVDVILF
ncbi:MAG TPA: gephyrin-like molybdotransferase Glp [Thermodesulfovibrionales bacterium]|nr:gephyrin-like molybdotransferase Glp [Thermodesulfovibrionales bacterium]